MRKFSAYKKKGKTLGKIYTNETKNTAIMGDQNIANLLADRFGENHRITENYESPHSSQVNTSISKLLASDTFIEFNDNNLALYSKRNDKLKSIAEGSDLLCSVDEIKERNNKKSHGNDLTPMFLIKKSRVHQYSNRFQYYLIIVLPITISPKHGKMQ